ncbi:hypothetical protein CWM52_24920 [Raoultella sp. T31]|nr:hypothetical protein CWM52_24920 [Raoultella sp. T31]
MFTLQEIVTDFADNIPFRWQKSPMIALWGRMQFSDDMQLSRSSTDNFDISKPVLADKPALLVEF